MVAFSKVITFIHISETVEKHNFVICVFLDVEIGVLSTRNNKQEFFYFCDNCQYCELGKQQQSTSLGVSCHNSPTHTSLLRARRLFSDVFPFNLISHLNPCLLYLHPKY